MAPESAAVRVPAPNAALRGISLHHIEFTREGDWELKVAEGAEVESVFTLAARRLPNKRLGVEIGARMHDAEVLKIEVIYHLEFEVASPPEDPAALDEVYRNIAARLAPVVALPYMRELIHSITGRASRTPVILPVLNIGAAFSPESIKFDDDNE